MLLFWFLLFLFYFICNNLHPAHRLIHPLLHSRSVTIRQSLHLPETQGEGEGISAPPSDANLGGWSVDGWLMVGGLWVDGGWVGGWMVGGRMDSSVEKLEQESASSRLMTFKLSWARIERRRLRKQFLALLSATPKPDCDAGLARKRENQHSTKMENYGCAIRAVVA